MNSNPDTDDLGQPPSPSNVARVELVLNAVRLATLHTPLRKLEEELTRLRESTPHSQQLTYLCEALFHIRVAQQSLAQAQASTT